MSTECQGCPACEPLRAELEEKDRLIVALQERMRNDVLTGVHNRRSLTSLIDDELMRSSRTGQPFCFAVIGIDGMKAIIEQFGPQTGDLVLQTIARESCLLLRTLDRFGRIGDDEFGIILPVTWLHQGVLAMNRLNAFIAGFDWGTVTPGQNVTFSTGLTTNAPAEKAESMIERALKALAEAKAAGPNNMQTLEQELPASLFANMDD